MTMCIYISTQYQSEHSKKFTGHIHRLMKMDIVEVSSVLLVIQEIFYFYSNDPK